MAITAPPSASPEDDSRPFRSSAAPAPQTGRRVAGATAIMMTAILASRLLGLVRNAVIAHQLGQKELADVYSGAFQIPDLLFYLIAGGALSSSFIPVFTEKITHGKDDEGWHVFSTVACIMFVVISAFIVVGEIFATPLTHLAANLSGEKLALCVPLTRIILPAQICFFLGGLLMGVQYSKNRFKIPALGPIIYNIGIIFGAVVLFHRLGLPGMMWGALIGALVGNFALQLWAVKREGMVFRISFDIAHPDVVKVWKLMLPVVLGVALPQVSIWVNRWYAGGLGNGPMAALTYANQLMQVPLGLFAQAMAVAIFPTLSAMAAQKQYGQLRSTSSRGIRTLLFMTIPSSVFMVILAVPIIELLLQSGKFHHADTMLCASALQWYGVGIFAWSAQSILSRSFYAMQDSVTPVVIGTVVTFVFVPLNWLFARSMGMGIEGLALATTVAAVLHMVAMMAVLRKRLRGFEMGPFLLSVGKTVVAAGLAGVACWAVYRALGGDPGDGHVKLRAAIIVLCSFGAGLLVYAGSASALKMDEMRQAATMVRRRFARA